MKQLLKYLLVFPASLLITAAKAQPLSLGIPSGHTAEIDQAAISSNSRFTITSSKKDQSVRVWETFTGKLIFTTRLNTAPTHVSFDPAAKHFLITTADSVMLFSNEDGRRMFAIDAGSHAAFSADGRFIYASDPFARYDLSGKLVEIIRDTRVDGIIQSSNGKYIAATVTDWGKDTLLIYGDHHQTPLHAINEDLEEGLGNDDYCKSFMFSPDGNFFYYKSTPDATLKVIETATGRQLLQFRDQYDVHADFHPAGRFISVVDDNVVKTFDLRSGRVVRIIPSKAIDGSESI
ncbi:MAG TPA: hypothetical protein VF145_06290, partial [Chitinophagaceae bacterium]